MIKQVSARFCGKMVHLWDASGLTVRQDALAKGSEGAK
jgi:hypothetical protein